VSASTSAPADATLAPAREKHPPGLFLLFGVEMWERFSYYGMRALLVLYMVDKANGGLGWSKEAAQKLYGWYGFLVYLLPVGGGILADRIIGTHRALLIGSIIIASGHFCLAIPGTGTFLPGLGLIILGTGFFKANVSTMVGQLYRENDPRRDGAFTIFYMGINAGAFLGPIICGWLQDNPRFGWHWGFGAAGVGMVLSLLLYVTLKQRFLPGIGLPPERRVSSSTKVAAAPLPPLTQAERSHVLALFVVFIFIIFFWAAFEQAGSSMNLFAAEHTRLSIFGFKFPASWFQSANPIIIVAFAPLFALMWRRLELRGADPSTPAKMAIGIALVGVGFLILVAAARFSDKGAVVGPGWLLGAYFLHTFGELCLSPIGLALVTRLAPKGRTSLFMGLWFAATALSELIAGQLAAATDKIARGELFHFLGGQADFFFIFVVTSFVSAAALAALTPWLRKLMK
jgi:POT family proton-dependent oligopeptide transporter